MRQLNKHKSWLNSLKTFGEIGSEKVSETLSVMVGGNFEIESIKANLCTIMDIPKVLNPGGSSELLISINMSLAGQLNGRSVLVFPWESAERLDRKLWSQIDTPPQFLSEISYLALKELGNVITSTYMILLEDYLDVTLMPTVPEFSVGFAKSVLESLIYEYTKREKFLFCLSTGFIEKELAIKGNILIFLVSQSTQILLKSLKKNSTTETSDFIESIPAKGKISQVRSACFSKINSLS